MTITLYNYDLDESCYLLRLAGSCLGVEMAVHNIDMFPGREHLGPAMRALNPAGRLPVLVEGALVLTQPAAMLLHLAQSHAPGHALLPADPLARARMFDWLAFATGDLAVAHRARAVAMLNAPGDGDALRIAARACLRIMDDHMTRAGFADEPFFAGPATLADLALFPAFALSRDYGVDHDEFPALRLWARRVRHLPGFITMPGIPDYH